MADISGVKEPLIQELYARLEELSCKFILPGVVIALMRLYSSHHDQNTLLSTGCDLSVCSGRCISTPALDASKSEVITIRNLPAMERPECTAIESKLKSGSSNTKSIDGAARSSNVFSLTSAKSGYNSNVIGVHSRCRLLP